LPTLRVATTTRHANVLDFLVAVRQLENVPEEVPAIQTATLARTRESEGIARARDVLTVLGAVDAHRIQVLTNLARVGKARARAFLCGIVDVVRARSGATGHAKDVGLDLDNLIPILAVQLECAKFAAVSFANPKEAAEAELHLIQTLKPRHNRSHNREYVERAAPKRSMRIRDMYVGDNLKRLRARKYLTQRQLAEKAGVSPDTIAKLETNRTEPRYITLFRLAAALECTPDDITGYGRED
jgi:DNA-binding XRE family transcriptional regulator